MLKIAILGGGSLFFLILLGVTFIGNSGASQSSTSALPATMPATSPLKQISADEPVTTAERLNRSDSVRATSAAKPSDSDTADPREGYSLRLLNGIVADEQSGALKPSDARQRYSELADRHGGTKAGKEAAARLKALGPAKEEPGLRVRVYAIAGLNRLPDMANLTPVRVCGIPDINLTKHQLWKRFGRADNLALQFYGFVNVPTSGEYAFSLASDDGSQLFVAGSMLINNDGTHAVVQKDGRTHLKAGRHAIAVHYFNGGGDAGISLRWSGPGFETRLIPEQAFSSH